MEQADSVNGMREGDKLFLFVPAEFPKANPQSQYFMDILEPEWQVNIYVHKYWFRQC